MAITREGAVRCCFRVREVLGPEVVGDVERRLRLSFDEAVQSKPTELLHEMLVIAGESFVDPSRMAIQVNKELKSFGAPEAEFRYSRASVLRLDSSMIAILHEVVDTYSRVVEALDLHNRGSSRDDEEE